MDLEVKLKALKNSLFANRRRTLVSSVAILIVVIALFWLRGCGASGIALKTASVTRGDLAFSIDATGTLEPEEVIDVGAQVAGKIESIGTDLSGKEVDYGSLVDENTILAKIDDSLYSADAAQASAEVERSKAELIQAQAKLLSTENDWKRAQKIGPSEALSKTSFDAYRANYEVAKAGVGVAEAAVDQAEAALARSERNLGYTTIKAPVKGTVIDKRVNIGQTVVASLNAPSLFLLAKDLTRMQVWVSVNEADIGRIRPGQQARFTVDAYPGEVFTGKVEKVRLNASMTQNVVTYIVEVATDNSNGKLLPYLTANVQFLIEDRHDVLLVPNAALRWVPPSQLLSPEPKDTKDTDIKILEQDSGIVWVKDGRYVRPIKVTVKGSDDVMTEIEGAGISTGFEVITGHEDLGNKSGSNVNPFAPQIMRGGRRM